jgi:hypothetical protein
LDLPKAMGIGGGRAGVCSDARRTGVTDSSQSIADRRDTIGLLCFVIFNPQAIPLRSPYEFCGTVEWPDEFGRMGICQNQRPTFNVIKDQMTPIGRLIPPGHARHTLRRVGSSRNRQVRARYQIGAYRLNGPCSDLTAISVIEQQRGALLGLGQTYDSDSDARIVARQVAPFERGMGEGNSESIRQQKWPKVGNGLALAY